MATNIRRRELISTLCGMAVVWPLVARAQQPRMPVIGSLFGASAAEWADNIAGFRRGLAETDFVEGRNVVIEYRWAESPDQMAAMAADFISRKVAVIVTGGNIMGVRAVLAATRIIPIVFTTALDPVAAGLVASLNRPGGNATGVNFMGGTLMAKQLELMHEVVPQEKSFAVLLHTATPGTDLMLKDLQGAARVMGVELRPARVNDERDFETAFATLGQEKVGALVVPGGAFLLSRRNQIVSLAARHRIPTIYSDREEVVAGGLLSYGPSQTEAYRGAGVYVSKILKGAKPADLPVDESTKFELVVNLQTAKSLGVEMPLSLLMRVSEAIE